MRGKKRVLMLLLTLCLTILVTGGIAINENITSNASPIEYFNRIKIKDCVVKLEYDAVEWTGEEKRPQVTVTYMNNELEENVDYVVEYKNNKSAGKAKVKVRGIGEYRGTRKVSFKINDIERVSLYDCSVKLEYDIVEWTGEEKKPQVTITYMDNELVENVDYMVKYENNISAGRANVSIEGIGRYRGYESAYFIIKGIDIEKDCTYRLNGSSVYIYNNDKLVDPSNYKIDVDCEKIKLYEREFSTFVTITYLVRKTYTVEGIGQYSGSFSYVTEDIDYGNKPIRN